MACSQANINESMNKVVIYIGLNEYKPDEPGKLMEELINKKEYDFDNALTVLDKYGIGQRKY
jgi:hypothetical protein